MLNRPTTIRLTPVISSFLSRESPDDCSRGFVLRLLVDFVDVEALLLAVCGAFPRLALRVELVRVVLLDDLRAGIFATAVDSLLVWVA